MKIVTGTAVSPASNQRAVTKLSAKSKTLKILHPDETPKPCLPDSIDHPITVMPPSRMHIQKLSSVYDEERSGRPSLITEELVHAIDEKIKENRKLTISALAMEFPRISRSLMHEIVTDKLKFHKLCARWVPKILTESHKTKWMGCALEFLTRYHEGGVDFLSQEMKLGFLMTPLKVSGNQWNGGTLHPQQGLSRNTS
ncbi:histone-lysine N-methyltransferase SETMAR [Trichonephila clavipes]|nr:histone-lysine N-methyltransferase SETMAR [Trichonephila clavipes]